eukprot:Blabericola_migrator_1__401@NODE_10_length_25093_cov_104_131184_g7_i2_p6_GENE_NODE_10_length_25093_cov_104_131184_g7_i2NODE_10_length_25093_cov_104_131184_g7_i2_p6_ORF_typecomplete_len521_score53_25PLDc_2/PF13091_6/2_7e17PLDc_2/PF13091_6/3_1e14Regulator_TrmB/PF11495_8/0_00079Regulator_TrmB/PF11495_8/0_055PLDc/PF00614_22/1_7PLDc/PF00614_22/22Peripla_BP_4/PF13407_6/0_016_NODE_10_length_25093_cov_104_131184_g7_i248226384
MRARQPVLNSRRTLCEEFIYNKLYGQRKLFSDQSIGSPYVPVHYTAEAATENSAWAQVARAIRPDPSSCPLATRCIGRLADSNSICSWLRSWSRRLGATIDACDNGRYFSDNNTIRLFDDGDACFHEILKRIDQAQRRVWLETYILGDDQTELIDHLKQAVRRGVDVVVAVDSLGSIGIPKSLKTLKQEGAKIIYFNPWWRRMGPLVYRNHRKNLICDNTGFVGSMNFDSRAYGSHTPPRSFWFNRKKVRPNDYNQHLEIQGPAVQHLCHSFLRVLQDCRVRLAPRYSGCVDSTETRLDVSAPDTFQKVCLHVLESDGKKAAKRSIPKMIAACLKEASESIVVATSYFHPPGRLRRALGHTVRRGVPTTLVLSGLSDVPFDSQATLSLLPYFLMGARNRARAFFVNRQHTHLKTFTADGIISLIGSFNWDRYSYRRNRELALAILDARVTRLVNQKIDNQIMDGTHIRPGTIEYTLSHAGNVSILRRVGYLLSYHLVRSTGGSFWDGFHPFKKSASELGS